MFQELLKQADHPAAKADLAQATIDSRRPDGSPPDVWWRVEQMVKNRHIERMPTVETETDNQINYVPTVRFVDAYRAAEIFNEQGVETVYSLGAGDCRAELYLADQGFDVTAYELNPVLVDIIDSEFEVANFELREQDYHAEFEQLVDPDVGYLIIGGNNKPPRIPEQGTLIEGYSEMGVRAYQDGTPNYVW